MLQESPDEVDPLTSFPTWRPSVACLLPGSSLLRLPIELLLTVCSLCGDATLAQVRASCRALDAVVARTTFGAHLRFLKALNTEYAQLLQTPPSSMSSSKETPLEAPSTLTQRFEEAQRANLCEILAATHRTLDRQLQLTLASASKPGFGTVPQALQVLSARGRRRLHPQWPLHGTEVFPYTCTVALALPAMDIPHYGLLRGELGKVFLRVDMVYCLSFRRMDALLGLRASQAGCIQVWTPHASVARILHLPDAAYVPDYTESTLEDSNGSEPTSPTRRPHFLFPHRTGEVMDANLVRRLALLTGMDSTRVPAHPTETSLAHLTRYIEGVLTPYPEIAETFFLAFFTLSPWLAADAIQLPILHTTMKLDLETLRQELFQSHGADRDRPLSELQSPSLPLVSSNGSDGSAQEDNLLPWVPSEESGVREAWKVDAKPCLEIARTRVAAWRLCAVSQLTPRRLRGAERLYFSHVARLYRDRAIACVDSLPKLGDLEQLGAQLISALQLRWHESCVVARPFPNLEEARFIRVRAVLKIPILSSHTAQDLGFGATESPKLSNPSPALPTPAAEVFGSLFALSAAVPTATSDGPTPTAAAPSVDGVPASSRPGSSNSSLSHRPPAPWAAIDDAPILPNPVEETPPLVVDLYVNASDSEVKAYLVLRHRVIIAYMDNKLTLNLDDLPTPLFAHFQITNEHRLDFLIRLIVALAAFLPATNLRNRSRIPQELLDLYESGESKGNESDSIDTKSEDVLMILFDHMMEWFLAHDDITKEKST
jgi:hypothetical protein